MGEVGEPTPLERIERRTIAAAIVESVINDEAMAHGLTPLHVTNRWVFDAKEVESLAFKLAHEVVKLQEDEHERIHRVGDLLAVARGTVTVDVDELRRIYLLGEERGRAGAVSVDAESGVRVRRDDDVHGPIVTLDLEEARALRMIRTLTGAPDLKRLATMLGAAHVVASHWKAQDGVNAELLDKLVDAMEV